ncbi:hypothetical protein DOY81_013628 [Sarcophaga bullata]|nr:hypothetical protein DOY81_013628 [Sarcophaga bullata]
MPVNEDEILTESAYTPECPRLIKPITKSRLSQTLIADKASSTGRLHRKAVKLRSKCYKHAQPKQAIPRPWDSIKSFDRFYRQSLKDYSKARAINVKKKKKKKKEQKRWNYSDIKNNWIWPALSFGEVKNMTVVMHTKTRLYEKGGFTFYNVTSTHVDFKLEGLKSYFSNLFNGQKQLEDSTNKFFNDNWRMLTDALYTVITQTIQDILLDVLRKIFHYIPANFFVTDIPTSEQLYGKGKTK